jgi:hypothetical protein
MLMLMLEWRVTGARPGVGGQVLGRGGNAATFQHDVGCGLDTDAGYRGQELDRTVRIRSVAPPAP